MNAEYMTFRSDYLVKTYYVLGDYCFLKSGVFKNKLPRVYFTKAMRQDMDCDILVVNLRGRRSFRMPPPNPEYRCTIYTLRPFESLIRYLEYTIGYRCVIFDLFDSFLVLNLDRGMDAISLSLQGGLADSEMWVLKARLSGRSLAARADGSRGASPTYYGSSSTGIGMYAMLQKLGYVGIFECCVNNLLRSFASLDISFTDEEEADVAEERLEESRHTYQKRHIGRRGMLVAYVPRRCLGTWKEAKIRKREKAPTTDKAKRMRLISLSRRPGSPCASDLMGSCMESFSSHPCGRGIPSHCNLPGMAYNQPLDDSVTDADSCETSDEPSREDKPIGSKRDGGFYPGTESAELSNDSEEEPGSGFPSSLDPFESLSDGSYGGAPRDLRSVFGCSSSQSGSQDDRSCHYRQYERPSSQV